MASPAFPEPPPAVPATPFSDAEQHIQTLTAKKDAWVRTPVEERARLLRACIATTLEAAPDWVADAARARGLTPQMLGEEWAAGPMVTVRCLRLLAEAMDAGGKPSVPEVKTRPDGWQTIQVFPRGFHENAMYSGFVGEIWIEPGKTVTYGALYTEKAAGKIHPGKVALVLGAGNVSSIGPTDVLSKLFYEDEVVLVKTNPVNSYLAPHWERAFRPLMDAGVLRIVNGGAEIGSFLCQHPQVDTIHITGSDQTHDAIVWGSGSDRALRKAENRPVLNKPITSELGCVTPVIVVPGEWSEADLSFQARHVAGMVTHNASFNCNAAKVLITAADWPQRAAFLQKLREVLASVPSRRAYYPGAGSRYQAFLSKYPAACPLSPAGSGIVPWTLLPDVPATPGEYALNNEAFCGVLADMPMPGKDAADFLPGAVSFANDHIWGTLSCCILVHPSTEKQHPQVVDKAIASLRYGGIGINVWPGVIFGSMALPWGAYPGHTFQDIRSGIGFVHNSCMIEPAHHSVLRAPFRIFPYPLWAAGHANLTGLAKAVTKQEAAPGMLNLMGLVIQAVQG